jgi:LysM repeat protein
MNTPGSGRWNQPYGDADSTGGLQIQLRTWNDYGGQRYAPQPYLATKQEQILIAEKILKGQGPGAWVCNAPGHGIASGALNGQTGVDPYPNGTGGSTTPPTPTSTKYTVKPGDTLYWIAKDHGVKGGWQALYAANRATIKDPDLIYPGQVLNVPRASAPAPKQSGTKANGVVSFMRSQLGKPYVHGGNGPYSYDCSGLTVAAYKAQGVVLPRLSQQQSLRGTPVPLSQAKPGDLLYWGSPGAAHHVAVYIGDSKFIGAQNPSSGVVEHPFSYSPPTGARRLF